VNNLSQREIENILQIYRVIAVVGLSKDQDKPSYRVSEYMQIHGYRIVPVNPTVGEVLGEKSYKSLLDIPLEIQQTIEVVDIFRRPTEVVPVVEQAIKLKLANGKPHVVWMQVGIVDLEAAEAARKSGLTVVMDRCIMIEHRHVF
jgi:predicted CoA-binding protein